MTILIPIIAALLFAVFTGFSGFNIGQKVERAEWQQRELKVQAEGEKKAAERRATNALTRMERDTKLAEVISEKDEENNKLRNDIATLSKRGLYVTATKCKGGGDRVPAETYSPGLVPGSTDRVRLPEPTESDLIALAQDAQLVVQQYNQCRGLLSTLVVTNPGPVLQDKIQTGYKTWLPWSATDSGAHVP